MKAMIGVESAVQARQMVKLLGRMKFPRLALDLTHVMDVQDIAESPQGHLLAKRRKAYFDQLENDGRMDLASIESYARDQGIPCSSQLLFGHVSNELLQHAERLHADLLMLGSNARSGDRSMLGGVGRKVIASARSSVMVVKDFTRLAEAGLTAIVATDHSPYASRCLEAFTTWAPTGIHKIIVASVYSEKVIDALTRLYAYTEADARRWIRAELERENARQLQRMRGLKASLESRVAEGRTGDVLARLMQEYRADFLVLGSQGYGFLESLMVGSLSLEQALARPYSVLLLRV